MSENKRFKRVYNKRKGQLYITDELYHNGDDYFPHNLDYDECIRLLNEYDKKYNEYRNDVLRLEKENEELKQENEGLKEKLCEFGVSDVKINGKRIDNGLEEWLE